MSISEAECIARAACPVCGQPIGERCVYMPPRSSYYDDVTHWGSNQKQVERAGKPTLRVHHERRVAVFKLRRSDPTAPSTGAKRDNELRVLEKFADGDWHDWDMLQVWGERLDMAFQRCYESGLVEVRPRGWEYRLTEAGRARLEEAR